MARNSERSPGALALAGVYLLLLLAALRPGVAQDFLPSYTAARLIEQGRLDAVYLPADAPHLFASAPAFVAASIAAGGPEVEARSVTAFVAPPPSLLPVLPLARLPYWAADTAWRLGLALLAIASLQRLVRRRSGSLAERRGTLWAMGTLGATPILLYALGLGQSALFLLGAAAFFGSERTRSRLAFCLLLAAAIVFKLFPALLLGFLWLMGRRSEAVWTALICAGWTGLAAILLPTDLAPAFLKGLTAVSGGVITGWNNLSLDALLLRLDTGIATWWFREPGPGLGVLLGAGKLPVLAAAVWVAAGRTGASAARRWGAAWAGTLTLSPLLWAHYLVVAPALLADRTPREAGVRTALLGACGLWLLLELSGRVSQATVGNLGSLLWLLIAGTLLYQGFRHGLEGAARPGHLTPPVR